MGGPQYFGNPTIWKMLLHTGLVHCRFVCKSRKREPYSMMYAFFQAVVENMSCSEVANQKGKKLYQVSYGNKTLASGTEYSNNPYNDLS